MNTLRILYYIFFFCFFSQNVISAPHHGDIFFLTQPDGSKVKVLVWGDEFYQHIESEDGYTLIRDDSSGWICYAVKDESGNLKSSGLTYGSQNGALKSDRIFSKRVKPDKKIVFENVKLKQQQVSYNKIFSASQHGIKEKTQPIIDDGQLRYTNGILKGITILIDFSDEPGTISPSDVDNMLNEKGYNGYGNNGSVHDYFLDISDSSLIFTNDVVGYYRAPHPKSYYDNPELKGYEKVDELLRAVLDSADLDVNFSLFSQSGDYLISVNFMYAGDPLSGWGKGLWPHSGFLGKSIDGVSIGTYQISRLSDELNIGTFCHESGHTILKLPDLYDYDGSSRGVGLYDIMGGVKQKNPAPLNAFSRMLCGWEYAIDISDLKENSEFVLPANENISLIYRHPYLKNEMFVVENRVKKNRNLTLPDEGLLIWHVDLTGKNDFEERTLKKHYYLSVIQADNQYHLENDVNAGGEGDLFHTGYNNRFNSSSMPAARWWDGSECQLDIRNIGDVSDTTALTVLKGEPVALEPIVLTEELENGLKMKLIKGDFKIMPDFDAYEPHLDGIVSNVSVSYKDLYENYALSFDGYLKVNETESYKVRLRSDDGSMLFLNDRLIINNTQKLNGSEQSALVLLKSGYYKIRIEYYQYLYNRGINFDWAIFNDFTKVPDSLLFYNKSAVLLEQSPKANLKFSMQLSSGKLYIEPNGSFIKYFEIYNINGVLIDSGSINSNNSFYINAPDGSGMHILRLYSEHTQFTRKFHTY